METKKIWISPELNDIEINNGGAGDPDGIDKS